MKRAAIMHIEVPNEWISLNDWDSHRPALWLSVQNTQGVVVEAGMGLGSTKLLSRYSIGRLVAHYDNNKEWLVKMGVAAVYVRDWLDRSIFPKQIGLLFVDLAPGESRAPFIEMLSNDAKVITVHDSEKTSSYVYGMEKTLSKFKYRLDYEPEGNPHTTIVSNYIDVTQWANHQSSISSTTQGE